MVFVFFFHFVEGFLAPIVNSLKVLSLILTSDPKEPLKYQANSIIRELHLSYGVLRLVVAFPKPSLPTLLVQTRKTEAEELKPRANGRNIVGQQLPTLLDVTCCVRLHTLLHVAQSLKPVKLFRQQLTTFLFFGDCRSVAQQCWIRLHSSSNIVEATNVHLLGVVASVCRPLPTRTQLPTLLAQQCWELLHPFARSLM